MRDSDDSSDSTERTARREFLALGGTLGIAAFAGCSGQAPQAGSNGSGGNGSGGAGAGNGSNSSGGSQGGNATTNSLTVPTTRSIPTNMQWNTYAPSHYATVGARMVFDPFLRYNSNTDEIIPYLFQDWTLDGKTLTVNLREGDTWHNGDAVTAEDVVTKFRLDQGFNYTIGNYVEKASAVDDTTVEYSLASGYREKAIMLTLASSWMDTPASRFGKFADQFSNASSDKERQDVQAKVQDFQPSEPLGSGPFQFNGANQQTLDLTKYEDHPDADQIPFPKYIVEYFSSSQQKWADMRNSSSIDVLNGFTPKDVVEGFPDSVRQYKVPRYNGTGLAFNHDDEDFGKRNVRRAVAYVLDTQKMAKLADPTKYAVKAPVGLGSFISGTWKESLGGDVSTYQKYTESGKAAGLLESEGYTKQGNQWHKPNGDQFTLEIPTPSGWSDVSSFMTTVAQMLSNFGIQTTKRGVENTTFFGQYWGSSNFKAAPWFWNNSGKTSPLFSLSWILSSGTVMSNLNYVEKPKAPPMGEPNGEATPTNVREMLRTLTTTTDQQKTTEVTRQLAWIVNQNLPMLPLIEKIRPSFWNTEHWELPPADTKKKYVNWCNYWWPRQGLVTRKE